MNVLALPVYYREFKIKCYQKIANYFILMLASVQQAGDSRFEIIYEAAIRFNQYCVDKEIYLD
jgi:hypothetical protein